MILETKFVGSLSTYTCILTLDLAILKVHFCNQELFIYKCCYMLYIFCKQFFKQIQVIFCRMHNSLSRSKRFNESRKSVIICKLLM